MKLAVLAIFLAITTAAPFRVHAVEKSANSISISFRDAPIEEVFEMLSRKERVNILLGRGVTGQVSVNLYDVSVKHAIYAIADAAGFAVEERNGDYRIVDKKEAGTETANGNTQIRSFKVQYSNPKLVAEILTKHLSRYGKITPLLERNLLVAEDLPDFLERLAALLNEIDVQPKQILIEAKILEITLDRSQTFGIDWTAILSGGDVTLGTQGLAPRGIAGFFFNLVNDNVELFLAAQSSKGRVHTLSTPRLLALENQEATTSIGDNLGYRVTTTINQVTTESIQFLETGIILRVVPSVDGQGRILMRIHPEVSSGSISAGIPSKKSTEVTTSLLAEDGQSILIGGLIKNSSAARRTGVPILSDFPVIGNLFSNIEEAGLNTETIVIITPHIVKQPLAGAEVRKLEAAENLLQKSAGELKCEVGCPDYEE